MGMRRCKLCLVFGGRMGSFVGEEERVGEGRERFREGILGADDEWGRCLGDRGEEGALET